jgi:hypothetical protein
MKEIKGQAVLSFWISFVAVSVLTSLLANAELGEALVDDPSDLAT